MAFSNYGPQIWNSLPKRIWDIDKLKSLKQQSKHHLFLKQYVKNNPLNKNIWVWYHLYHIIINVFDLHIDFIFVQSIIIYYWSKTFLMSFNSYAEYCE